MYSWILRTLLQSKNLSNISQYFAVPAVSGNPYSYPYSGWVLLELPTYPAVMKLGTVILYLKKIQEMYKYHMRDALSSANISMVSSEISNFCYIKK